MRRCSWKSCALGVRLARVVARVAEARDALEQRLELEEGLFLAIPGQRREPRVARRGLISPEPARVAQEVRVDVAIGDGEST
jgi:hypothetical protein